MLPRADSKLISAKALEVERRAQSNLDERGLDTLFLAIGFGSWPSPDGGSACCAPVILVPAIVKREGRQGAQGSLTLTGDPRINSVLLQKLEAEAGIKLSAEQLLPSKPDESFSPRLGV
ncbi:MAG: DUF4011 domain-containing protein, partial [Acidobacteriaceae bacterium]